MLLSCSMACVDKTRINTPQANTLPRKSGSPKFAPFRAVQFHCKKLLHSARDVKYQIQKDKISSFLKQKPKPSVDEIESFLFDAFYVSCIPSNIMKLSPTGQNTCLKQLIRTLNNAQRIFFELENKNTENHKNFLAACMGILEEACLILELIPNHDIPASSGTILHAFAQRTGFGINPTLYRYFSQLVHKNQNEEIQQPNTNLLLTHASAFETRLDPKAIGYFNQVFGPHMNISQEDRFKLIETDLHEIHGTAMDKIVIIDPAIEAREKEKINAIAQKYGPLKNKLLRETELFSTCNLLHEITHLKTKQLIDFNQEFLNRGCFKFNGRQYPIPSAIAGRELLSRMIDILIQPHISIPGFINLNPKYIGPLAGITRDILLKYCQKLGVTRIPASSNRYACEHLADFFGEEIFMDFIEQTQKILLNSGRQLLADLNSKGLIKANPC